MVIHDHPPFFLPQGCAPAGKSVLPPATMADGFAALMVLNQHLPRKRAGVAK
jgi:hypothetical protein